MGYLLLMTLAGSLLYGAYLLWIKLGDEYISQGMKYKALIIVLLFYTVPLAWLKGICRAFLQTFLPVEAGSGPEEVVGIAGISAEAEAWQTYGYVIMLLLFGTWGAVALYMMLKQSIKYFRHKRDIYKRSEDCSDEDSIKELLRSLKKELHYIGEIKVLRIQGECRSYTLGIFRPIIVLQEKCTEEEQKWILRHEVVHIAKGDLAAKWLSELVCCLHWFNPIVRKVQRELTVISELSCDERVARDHDSQEREVYAELVLASMQNRITRIVGSDFAGNPNVAEERLRIILNTAKIKKWKKLIALSLFLVLLLADSLLVLTYPCV